MGEPDFLVLLSAAVFTLLSNTLSALENDVLQAMNPARSNPRLGLSSPEVGGGRKVASYSAGAAACSQVRQIPGPHIRVVAEIIYV